MSKINALVLSGYGLNCDTETSYACELAGMTPTRVHINALIDGSVTLDNFQLMVLIGGFSWGDDHGGGIVQAVRMKTHIGDQMQAFIEKGCLVFGICNGFQVLANMGLLPGFDNDYTQHLTAVTYNDCGNFRDQWVRLKINIASPCVFTRNIESIDLPVRHGEGKFYARPEIVSRLVSSDQIVMQYATGDGEAAEGRFPDNPNGSVDDIAGICDPTGRIFGLMPHPEAYNHPANHPDWFYRREQTRRAGIPDPGSDQTGIRLFKNAASYLNQ